MEKQGSFSAGAEVWAHFTPSPFGKKTERKYAGIKFYENNMQNHHYAKCGQEKRVSDGAET